ncbi:MAG: cation transporter [Clostridia bacterium]|nr:cation transporter [Clostridia bacterium]
MSEILSKIFVKHHKDINNPVVRKDYGTMAGIVGIVINMILAAVKLTAGIFAHSASIIADAVNNLSDAGASLITFFSFKLSSKPADKEHPFGHARMEYICSIIVSFLILLVGIELLIDSAQTLLGFKTSEPHNITVITMIILAFSVLVKLWLGFFYKSIGKKIDSKVVMASATDSLMDSLSTGAVLITSLIVSLTGFAILDSIVGIIVSALVIVAGAKILNETKNALLGEAPVKETVDNIISVVEEYPEILGIHDLLVHNYGPHSFIASFHAEVDGKTDIYYLHDMIDNVERVIKERLNISCTIHMDPIVTDDEAVNELKAFLIETLKDASLAYPIHDFRTVIGLTHTNLIFDLVVPFDIEDSESEIIHKIQSAVSEKRPDHFCVITIDRG